MQPLFARDITTALPSTATSPCAARQFRHAFGIAPLGRDNPVNYSQPHPREALINADSLSESRQRGSHDLDRYAAGRSQGLIE
jgi:hypothetical protein